jgi:hypothetical protein
VARYTKFGEMMNCKVKYIKLPLCPSIMPWMWKTGVEAKLHLSFLTLALQCGGQLLLLQFYPQRKNLQYPMDRR